MLVKNPGFSATAVLTLAICLGANAAIFTVVHDVLVRPLPLADPGRIVGMGDIYPTITPNDILSNDTPLLRPAAGVDPIRVLSQQ